MFSSSFADFARRSGMRRFRFHDLRHSQATYLLGAGAHPEIVSERMGHSTVGITLDSYSHVLPGMQEDAVQLALEHGDFEGNAQTLRKVASKRSGQSLVRGGRALP
jgi:integrase